MNEFEAKHKGKGSLIFFIRVVIEAEFSANMEKYVLNPLSDVLLCSIM